MATLEQLRSVFGGDSDEAVILAASKQLGMPASAIADEVGYNVGGKWGNRLGASIDSYQANLYGLGEAMGSEWAGRRRQANDAQADLQRGFAREQGAVSSYKDVRSLGDFADYAGGLTVDSLPYLAEAAVGGLTGGSSFVAKAGLSGLSRAARGTLGAVAASYPSSVGDVLSNQREESGRTDLMSAAALGAPYAALNAFGVEGALARGRLWRNGIRALDDMAGLKGAAARGGATALGVGLQEGASETGQEFLNQAGRNAVNPNAGYFGPGALDRYGESFVGGFTLGGLGAGVGGGWRRSEGYYGEMERARAEAERRAAAELEETRKRDLLNEGQQYWALPEPTVTTRPQSVDPQYLAFGNEDPYALPPYDPWRETPPAGGAAGELQPGFPEHIAEPDTARVMHGAGGPSAGEVTATDADNVAIMDPGAVEARRQAMARMEAERARLQAAKDAEARHAANRTAATDALIDKNPDGTLPIKLAPREIMTYTALRELQAAKAADDAKVADLVGQMREALKNNDNKTLNAVAKEVKALKEQADAANSAGNGGPGADLAGRGAGSQQLRDQGGLALQPDAVPAATQAVGSVEPAGVRPGVGNDALTTAAKPAEPARVISDVQPDPAGPRFDNRPALVDWALPKITANEKAQQAYRLVKGVDTGTPMAVRAAAREIGVDEKSVRNWVAGIDPIVERLALVHEGAKATAPAQTAQRAQTYSQEDLQRLVRAYMDKQANGRAVPPYVLRQAIERVQALGEKERTDALRAIEQELGLDAATESEPALQEEYVAPSETTQAEDDTDENLNIGERATSGAAVEGVDEADAARMQRAVKAAGPALVSAWNDEAASFVPISHRLSWDQLDVQQKHDFMVGGADAEAFKAVMAMAGKNEVAANGSLKTDAREAAAGTMSAASPEQQRSMTTEALNRAGLTPDEMKSLERAYKAKRGTPEFLDKLAADAQKGAREGQESLNRRGVIVAKVGRQLLNVGGDTGPAKRATHEEILAMPGFDAGHQLLEDLGIGHAADWVTDWFVGTGASYERVGSRQKVTLKPAEGSHTGQARFDYVHEVGHAVDNANFGDGVYSSHPDLAFDENMEPVGEVAAELGEALQWYPDNGAAALLAYPFSQEEYGHVVTTPRRASQELLAQLLALYSHPRSRADLAQLSPKAIKFIEAVIHDVKQTRPTQAHSDSIAYRRAGAFQRATPAGGPATIQGGGRLSRQPGRSAALANVSSPRTARALEALSKEQALNKRLEAYLPGRAKGAWERAADFFRRKSPWLLTNFQLAQQFGDKIKTLKTYVGLQQMLTVERTKQAMVFHDVATAWDKLDAPVKDRLNQLMQRATLREIHPDLAFDHKDNAHLEPSAKAEHADLAAQYAALPDAAKAVYQQAKKALQDSWEARGEAYKALVSYTYSKRIAEALEAGQDVDQLRRDGERAEREYESQMGRLKGPYFPLLRFGEYLAIGESAEFKRVKDELAQTTGPAREKLQEQLDKLKRDPKHYEVSAHENRADQNRAVRALAARGLDARADMADQRLDTMRSVSKDTLDHLTTAVNRQFDGKVATEVNAALTQVFMRSLPEISALHREAERKGVEGASADMLRAFAAAGEQNAFYTSRLMYASEMADTLFQMKQEVKGDIDLQHIHREMEQRMALDLRHKPTPVQDVASTLSWTYHLGISPSFALINATQPWLVTGPVLAGKFGLGKATGALSRAARDALAVMKAARWKDGKFDLWSGISEDTIPGPSVSEDRKAIRALMQRGIVDEGMQHELNMFAADSSRALAKINRGMGWMTQQIELTNRLTTALAAFRLARAEGMEYDAAVNYAYEATVGTQMDYSAEGTARFMREGGGIPLAKLIFQFRRYQQAMLYLMGDNIKKSFGSGPEAKTARATLAYFTVTSAMSAGAMGLPFMGSALALAGVFSDPDDERGDPETRLRNALFDLTGDRELATVLAKGVPAMFGADLSKRIGMADLAQAFPMTRFDGKTGQDQAGKLLLAMFGPVAGVGAQWYDAAARFGQGDWAKGAEKLVPKAAADVLRAARYHVQGMTDSKGEQILGSDEISAWNKTLRMLGVASTQESNYYEGTAALKNTERAINDRKAQIGNRFKAALRDGDMASVREEIAKFNQDHPGARITGKDEVAWRRATLKSQQQRDESGVRFDPRRDKAHEDVLRFAR